MVNPKTGCDDTTEVVVASNIPCGINYSNVPLLDSTVILTVARDSTLFCSDLVHIQKGDVIVINKIEYKAQLPTKYEGSHQEVIMHSCQQNTKALIRKLSLNRKKVRVWQKVYLI